jgi:hypothetical protein
LTGEGKGEGAIKIHSPFIGSLREVNPLIKINFPFRKQGVLRGVQPLLVTKTFPLPVRERARVRVK